MAAEKTAFTYSSIVKFDKNDDGTLIVYGKATDDSLDIDLQICDPDWLASAMPAWFKSGGNIREQHSSVAAGVATDYEAKGSEHFITALVVDPTSIKKVEAGVLKGFSIGIKSPRVIRDNKAANGRIVDGQIVEVSLVDRPANPNAKLMLAKALEGDIMQVEEYSETADIVKFDSAAFESARDALASLIASEAEEIKLGHDERMSLVYLIEAVGLLHAWYEHEKIEGEVVEDIQDVELAAEKSADAEPAADIQDEPAADEEAKNAEISEAEPQDEPLPLDGLETPQSGAESQQEPLEADTVKDSDNDLSDSVEKAIAEAVDAALAPFRAEIADLKAAKEAAEDKAMGLENDLAEAMSKAAAGGPKRTGKPSEASLNDNAIKAAHYRAKAAAATDPMLAKGYKAMAEEYDAKAKSANNSL